MPPPLLIVIDDDLDMANVAQTIGTMSGFESKVATSPMEFHKLILDRPPSAIIMDIVMPQMDAFEQLSWLADHGHFVPVILMSGYSKRYMEPASHYGNAIGIPIAGSLSKPFSVEKLQGLLKKILDPSSKISRGLEKTPVEKSHHQSP